MPDVKQRALEALEHLKVFEAGALADIKAELGKLAGLFQGNGDPVPASEPDETPAAPEAPAAAAAKPATGS